MSHPVLSEAEWSAVKIASIRGVPDQELADEYGLKRSTIRARRNNDSEWRSALLHGSPRSRSIATTDEKDSTSVENRLKRVLSGSLEAIAAENPLLLAQYTHSKLSDAVKNDLLPDIESWSDMKTANDLLRKSVGLDREQPGVTLNLFGGGSDSWAGGCVYEAVETQEGESAES